LIYADGKEPESGTREELIQRHLAWINALAHQLRQRSRLKDSHVTRIFDHRLLMEGVEYHHSPDSYRRFLSPAEQDEMSAMENPAVHILRRQGDRLSELAAAGFLDSYRLVRMMQALDSFYDSQGKCERIKNTPFPRQVANFGQIFTWFFIFLPPLAFVEVFETTAEHHELSTLVHHEYVFTLVPFTVLIAWVFYVMEKVSDSTEDPFEGGVTDVPISSLCRLIEVDLKQMLGEPKVPKRLEAIDGVLY
jgi:putative membrane protein